jgi:hypothetical protein
MAPLLTQTLPLPSVLIAWDALFSCPTRTRDGNPKLEYLLDICTSMLIRARPALFRSVLPLSDSAPLLTLIKLGLASRALSLPASGFTTPLSLHHRLCERGN